MNSIARTITGVLAVALLGMGLLGATGGDCSPVPVEPEEPTCDFHSDCAWGFECDAGLCVESACHADSPDGDLPALDCPSGFACEYGDAVDANHGNGYCVPAPTCGWHSDCPWGFECHAGQCEESECHPASPNGDLPALDCPSGYGCEYGDAVDANHGNGYCMPAPVCAFHSDCSWGFECHYGQCEESDCHPASPDGSLPARECPPPGICMVGDSIDANHGNGYCDYGP